MLEKTKFRKLSFTFLSSNQQTVYDFEVVNKVPFYVVELILNIFDMRYYILPNDLEVQFEIECDKVLYTIVARGNRVSIPEDLNFLVKDQLYKLLFIPLRINDIYYEYDFFFKPMLLSTTNSQYIHTAILEDFETYHANNFVENQTSCASSDEAKLAIETLKAKIQDILARLETLTAERDKLLSDEAKLRTYLHSKDALDNEQKVLEGQIESLKESKMQISEKVEKAKALLNKVDLELLSAVEAQNTTYAEFLREKKVIIQGEYESFYNAYMDICKLLDDALFKYKQLKDEFIQLGNYSFDDLTVINTKIKNIDKEYDVLYSALVSFEVQLKDYQSQATRLELTKTSAEKVVEAPNLKKASTMYFETGGHEKHNIFVYNYLKYYYAYHVTNLAQTELKELLPNYDDTILLSIASRVFFLRKFGLVLPYLLSPYPFMDRNLQKVITLEQD